MKENKAIDYELMVKELFSQKIAQKWSIKNFRFFHRKRFKGIDNNLYEVDIAFEFKIASCKLLGIIECKNYSRPVERNVVAEFITKKSQLNANFGLIVSPLGFQKGAVDLARNKGIELAQVYEYTYIPFIGEPELLYNYLDKIADYIQNQDKSFSRSVIESYLDKLEIGTENAYRAEDTSDLELPGGIISDSDALVRSDIGFKMITDNKPVLVDKKDLLLILYCQSLLTAEKLNL